jgi:hypothetical protein
MILQASPKVHPDRVKHGMCVKSSNIRRKNNSLIMFHPFTRPPSRTARTRRDARIREGWGERVKHGSFLAGRRVLARGNSTESRQSLLRLADGRPTPTGALNSGRWPTSSRTRRTPARTMRPSMPWRSRSSVSASASRSSWTRPASSSCGHTRWKAAQKLGLAAGAGPRRARPDAGADPRVPHRGQQDRRAGRVEPRPAAHRAGRAAGRRHRLVAARLRHEDELAKLLDGQRREAGPDRSRTTFPSRRTIRRRSAATCGAGRPSPAVRRQRFGGGRRPPARRPTDSPGQHGPAVQREGRAAQQHAIAAGLSSFGQNKKAKAQHAPPGLRPGATGDQKSTDPKKARKKMRAKDRPLENDFVSDEAFDRLLLAWFGNASRVLSRAGRSTSGVATPISATTPAAQGRPGCISARASSGTSSIRC